MFGRSSAVAALLTLFAGFTARADEHPYSEGPVVKVSRVRTEYGHFEDYMKWLDTKWKQLEETAKKAGYIVSYEVLTAEPRDINDPDILLVVTYKNWAAMDNWIAKEDELIAKVEGSVASADKSAAARGSIRRVLGSSTMQVLNLK